MNKLRFFSKIWLIYGALSFPLFYFVYKYGTTDLGLLDFYSYYKLYNNWDLQHTDAPFNMRLVGSFFVYLFNQLGLHYDTITNFDRTNLDRQVFFNAVFFNYLCVVSTCLVIFSTIKKAFNDSFYAFVSGLIYLLGFGTLFYEIMPLTDAFSILIFSIIIYGYVNRRNFIFMLLIILIIQREYIFLALGLISILDYWKHKAKYYLHIFITCVICYVIYFILRKTIFYTPKYDYTTSFDFLSTITNNQIPLIPYFKQTLMTLNLFILYLFIFTWKKIKQLKTDNFAFIKLLLLFVQTNIIAFAAVVGNNAGRIFYILIPLVIYELAKEVKPLVNKNNDTILL